MKDKCIAIIQKQIILKINYFDNFSIQIWEDFHGMILASPSASQTHGLVLDFKACTDTTKTSSIKKLWIFNIPGFKK